MSLSTVIIGCTVLATIFSLAAVILQYRKASDDDKKKLTYQNKISDLQAKLLERQDQIIELQTHQTKQTDRLLMPIKDDFKIHYGLYLYNDYYSQLMQKLIRENNLGPDNVLLFTSQGENFKNPELQPFLDDVLKRIGHPTIIRFVNSDNPGPRLCLYIETPAKHFGFSYVPSKNCFQYDGDHFPIGITIKENVQSLKDLDNLKVLIQTNLNHFNYKMPKDSKSLVTKIEFSYIRIDHSAEVIFNEKSVEFDTNHDIFVVRSFKLPFKNF